MTPLLQSVATREGGIDAVFIALRGEQARAIAPQLAAAGLSYKPRVATSQLPSGTGNAEEDRVLAGIKFPTDRKRVVSGKSVSARVDLGSRRGIKKKQYQCT